MKGTEIGILLLILPIVACIVWYWQGKINERKRILNLLTKMANENNSINIKERGFDYADGFIDAIGKIIHDI